MLPFRVFCCLSKKVSHVVMLLVELRASALTCISGETPKEDEMNKYINPLATVISEISAYLRSGTFLKNGSVKITLPSKDHPCDALRKKEDEILELVRQLIILVTPEFACFQVAYDEQPMPHETRVGFKKYVEANGFWVEIKFYPRWNGKIDVEGEIPFDYMGMNGGGDECITFSDTISSSVKMTEVP